MQTNAEANDQPAQNISLPSSEQPVSDPRTEVRILMKFFVRINISPSPKLVPRT